MADGTSVDRPCSKFSVLMQEAEHFTLRDKSEEAERIYTQFIEQEGNSFESKFDLALARNNRGHLRYLNVDFHGAIQDYTEAIKLNPTLAVSYYNRGQIHYRMGRFGMAIEDLKKAIDLDPSFEDAFENLRQAEEDFAAMRKA